MVAESSKKTERRDMVAELLVEIGTEEIPSGYLPAGVAEFRRLADACLKEHRIDRAGGLFAFGTPRRLVLIGKAVAEAQEDLVEEMTGPPVKAAYDAEGRPTRAAFGFARKHGVDVETLERTRTPKGEYVLVRRHVPGRRTVEILEAALPGIMAEIPWPKSMRWGGLGYAFVRPIHWILALFGGRVISFEAAGVRSGNTTRGHRFMSPGETTVTDVADYLEKTRRAFVVIDPKERAQMIVEAVAEAASAAGGAPAEDPELVETNANLTEYPSVVVGAFDRGFLRLPEPVLVTAMKSHQRYFAVADARGSLTPHFAAVNNTLARDPDVVRKGHERVLRARLSDADFFFREDRKRPLKERLDDLKGVVYQKDLGTSHAKVTRFAALAEYLGRSLLPERLEDIRQAALLCKCDLVTLMVGEFPDLQGVMGEIYARLEGYPEAVCEAIREHYLPARAGGEPPSGDLGALVGVADRMDTIAGCFAVGLEPSGNADPFALRRHALAVIGILDNKGWGVSLQELVEEAVAVLRNQTGIPVEGVAERVLDFFRERYRNLMLRSGFDAALIEAVISAGFDRIPEVRARCEDLRRFARESAGFEELAVTFKRVSNILKKQETVHRVDPSRFQVACESDLWRAFQEMEGKAGRLVGSGRFHDALRLLAGLKPPVDAFFEGVEVLAKDRPELMENRVALLQRVSALLGQVADFSKLAR